MTPKSVEPWSLLPGGSSELERPYFAFDCRPLQVRGELAGWLHGDSVVAVSAGSGEHRSMAGSWRGIACADLVPHTRGHDGRAPNRVALSRPRSGRWRRST